jgi:hypothetical protein
LVLYRVRDLYVSTTEWGFDVTFYWKFRVSLLPTLVFFSL